MFSRELRSHRIYLCLHFTYAGEENTFGVALALGHGNTK